ncbi:Cytochrome c oxidase copper chaperone [Dionaea muscipula]
MRFLSRGQPYMGIVAYEDVHHIRMRPRPKQDGRQACGCPLLSVPPPTASTRSCPSSLRPAAARATSGRLYLLLSWPPACNWCLAACPQLVAWPLLQLAAWPRLPTSLSARESSRAAAAKEAAVQPPAEPAAATAMGGSLSSAGSALPRQQQNQEPSNNNNISEPEPTPKPKNKSICCACPDTKKLRDECMLEHGEAACTKWIEAHKQCLRAEGFNV